MAKDKKKGKKGKVAGGIGIAAVIAVLALFGGKGLGLGGGGGLGTGKDAQVNSDADKEQEKEKDPVEEKNEEKGAGKVSIEVKQGQYLIDGAEKSLADIEAMLTVEDAANISFTLVDNYAATKAWDEVKALFTKYDIAVTEQ